MENTAFPSREMKRLASFETRLQDDLSLKEIDEIEKKIVAETTDKTILVAGRLIDLFERKKPPLVQREITRLDASTDPLAKIKTLDSLVPYLDPEAVDERLDRIEWEASLISDPKVQTAVREKLQHLKFAQERPIMRDLREFVDQLKMIGKEVLSRNSLAPMAKELSSFQIGEIQRSATLLGGA